MVFETKGQFVGGLFVVSHYRVAPGQLTNYCTSPWSGSRHSRLPTSCEMFDLPKLYNCECETLLMTMLRCLQSLTDTDLTPGILRPRPSEVIQKNSAAKIFKNNF
ncbi:hypothetical protein J6590_077463 [Homalodisca vitripennis]|nr:hypothetical protein J6590_077463 [Homalodisca vitripennis]